MPQHKKVFYKEEEIITHSEAASSFGGETAARTTLSSKSSSAWLIAPIVYVGDGSGDLCAALMLRAGDTLLVRSGYGLEKDLKEQEKKGVKIRCHVLKWDTGEDLLEFLLSLSEPISDTL